MSPSSLGTVIVGKRIASIRRTAATALVGVAALVCAALAAAPGVGAAYTLPLESYAKYQPQKNCVTKDKPGTVRLARYLVDTRGGVYGGTLRSCRSGGQSEHKDGRAFDWMLDATSEDDQAIAEAFIVELTADDAIGDSDALARRMGIMYVIWDDKIYSAWYGFEPRPYLSSGCRSISSCSTTLRHRDHMHISLSKPGSKGKTSWYRETPAPTAKSTAGKRPTYTPVVD